MGHYLYAIYCGVQKSGTTGESSYIVLFLTTNNMLNLKKRMI